MDSSDGRDHRTFRVNFGSEGAARLRDRVKEKLKEFMGDYTDDTLVVWIANADVTQGNIGYLRCYTRQDQRKGKNGEPNEIGEIKKKVKVDALSFDERLDSKVFLD
ncbi:hypothetical protein ACLOJK_015088 [Asimina triloba]